MLARVNILRMRLKHNFGEDKVSVKHAGEYIDAYVHFSSMFSQTDVRNIRRIMYEVLKVHHIESFFYSAYREQKGGISLVLSVHKNNLEVS